MGSEGCCFVRRQSALPWCKAPITHVYLLFSDIALSDQRSTIPDWLGRNMNYRLSRRRRHRQLIWLTVGALVAVASFVAQCFINPSDIRDTSVAAADAAQKEHKVLQPDVDPPAVLPEPASLIMMAPVIVLLLRRRRGK